MKTRHMEKNKTLYEAPLAEAFSVAAERSFLQSNRTPSAKLSDYEETEEL